PRRGRRRDAPSPRRTPSPHRGARSRRPRPTGTDSSGPGSRSPCPRDDGRPTIPPAPPSAGPAAARRAPSVLPPPPRPLRRVLQDHSHLLQLLPVLVGPLELPLTPRLLARVEDGLLLRRQPVLAGKQHREDRVHGLELAAQPSGAFPREGALGEQAIALVDELVHGGERFRRVEVLVERPVEGVPRLADRLLHRRQRRPVPVDLVETPHDAVDLVDRPRRLGEPVPPDV